MPTRKQPEEQEKEKELPNPSATQAAVLERDREPTLEEADRDVRAAERQAMLDKINQDRVAQGLTPLTAPFRAPAPGEEFPLDISGVGVMAKQYVGVGPLNVNTGRGELKAHPGDFIITYADTKFVLPAPLFERMAKAQSEVVVIPLDEWIDSKVLNNKSGPDKFTFPAEPIGGERTDGGAPQGVVTPVSPLIRETTESKTPTQAAVNAELDKVERPGPTSFLTIDELKAKQARGETLTSDENLRLLDNK